MDSDTSAHQSLLLLRQPFAWSTQGPLNSSLCPPSQPKGSREELCIALCLLILSKFFKSHASQRLKASVEIPCTKNYFVQSPSGSKLPKNRNLRGVKTESVQRLTHKEESVSRRKSGESNSLRWDFLTPMASSRFETMVSVPLTISLARR